MRGFPINSDILNKFILLLLLLELSISYKYDYKKTIQI